MLCARTVEGRRAISEKTSRTARFMWSLSDAVNPQTGPRIVHRAVYGSIDFSSIEDLRAPIVSLVLVAPVHPTSVGFKAHLFSAAPSRGITALLACSSLIASTCPPPLLFLQDCRWTDGRLGPIWRGRRSASRLGKREHGLSPDCPQPCVSPGLNGRYPICGASGRVGARGGIRNGCRERRGYRENCPSGKSFSTLRLPGRAARRHPADEWQSQILQNKSYRGPATGLECYVQVQVSRNGR